jgi:hypothetical protein
MTQSTCQKYFNIDNYSKYGNPYVVRVVIKRKHFIVWRGRNKELGIAIAKVVEEVMERGLSNFLEWYDYEREEQIKELEKKWQIKTE